jgi:hypothetical protein
MAVPFPFNLDLMADQNMLSGNALVNDITQDWLEQTWNAQVAPSTARADGFTPYDQGQAASSSTRHDHSYGRQGIFSSPYDMSMTMQNHIPPIAPNRRTPRIQSTSMSPATRNSSKSFRPIPNLWPAKPTYTAESEPTQSPRTHFGPSLIIHLTIDHLVLPQVAIFIERIYPMIPVFSPSYLYEGIAIGKQDDSVEFSAMLLSLTALTLVHPLAPKERAEKKRRRDHAKMLLAETCRLRNTWDFGARHQFEAAMTSYFMFGALLELGETASARIRLREALSLAEMMRLNKPDGYDPNDVLDLQKRLRLFWVLAVTER